jgi:hypothetical protein
MITSADTESFRSSTKLLGCPAPDRLEDLPQGERGQAGGGDPQQRLAVHGLGKRGQRGVLRVVAAPGPGDPHGNPADQQVHDAVRHQADPDDDVEPGALVHLPAAPARGVQEPGAGRRFGAGCGVLEFAHHTPQPSH